MKFLKAADFVILILNIAVIVLLSFYVYSENRGEATVLIEAEGDEWIFPLGEDRIEHIHGIMGDTIVEISDGRVRIADSPCPDKLCVQMGWLENNNDWAACLPNGVFILVEGETEHEEIDALSE